MFDTVALGNKKDIVNYLSVFFKDIAEMTPKSRKEC